ncbi:hypothetical protein GC175_32715 [bacterium]|nr:hypothetical protein [bacterium]
MSSKSQVSKADDTGSKQRVSNHAAENLDVVPRQEHPLSVVQRAELDPKSLTRGDVLQLQRLIGNQKVIGLLSQRVQQPRVQREVSEDIHSPIAASPGRENQGDEVRVQKSGATNGQVMPTRDSERVRFKIPERRFQRTAIPGLVIQRDITVGGKAYKVDAKEIVDPTVKRVQGQLTTWGSRTGSNKLPKELTTKLKKLKGTAIQDEVIRLLKKYDNRTFVDIDDLGRQAEQDVMLGFLDLSEFEGIPQQLDQYTYNTKTSKAGPGSKKASFRIYRTMPVKYWEEYAKDKSDVIKLLHGHGGALGQALHYFQKSKANPMMDDVLVEFSFSGSSEEKMVDYGEISKGGEGNKSKGKKLGGKSEQNDVFDMMNIFSVDLGKNKELIASLKPEVRAVSFSKPERNKVASTGESGGEKSKSEVGELDGPQGALGPIDVMVMLGRMNADALNIMGPEDWNVYYDFKEKNPEYEYSV